MSVLSPCLLHVCSGARTQQSGTCQKRPVRRRIRGHSPRIRAATSGRPRPPRLDQWSRPSRSAPGSCLESPMPMPSRIVRPAGNRHLCGDTPLMPQARHAGYLPGMRWAAARRSRPLTSRARLRPKQQVRWVFPSGNGAQKNVRVRVTPCRPGMSTDCVQVYALQPRLQASAWTAAACGGYCRARQAGARAATAGLDAWGPAGIPAPERSPPHGLCAPGTAYGRVGTGRRDQHPGRLIRDGLRVGGCCTRPACGISTPTRPNAAQSAYLTICARRRVARRFPAPALPAPT